jgi:exosome complex component RRP4
MSASTDFLVIPGQVIAITETDDESSLLLRGHGTYIEHRQSNGGNNGTTTSSVVVLRAAIPGTVQRVNQLVSVLPISLSRPPVLQVGDLVVGRITNIIGARWMVHLGRGISCDLPLSGVHLSSGAAALSGGGGQRIRTATDALEMRQILREGDLVSAEVHKVMPGSSGLQLHTRSNRYGQLQNGMVVQVPAGLIPRLKQHYITMGRHHQFQVLLGCNGWIWLQRNHPHHDHNQSMEDGLLADEAQEEKRLAHAQASYTIEDRHDLARLRNSICCLKETIMEITPEHIEEVYRNSEDDGSLAIADMLLPENIVALTASLRKK